MQPTLVDLEQRLEPEAFFRVSRSAIVRLDAITEVRPLGGGHGEAVLADGPALEVSRRRFKDLIERLDRG
jgi:two-component system LytT family response regulator